MNLDDAFERILASLHEAALDDARRPAASAPVEEAVGAEASSPTVSEGVGDDLRVHFAGYPYRGEDDPDRLREYLGVYLPHDEGMLRLRRVSRGRPVQIAELHDEDELKSSPGYNKGLRLLGRRNGRVARIDRPEGLRIVRGMVDPVGGGYAPGGGSMTARRSSGRSRLALHVSPVGDREADFGGRRVAALVLAVEPARRARIDAQRVAATLGPTSSEGRVSALPAEGLKVREIAAATGWRENCVRWMIRQVNRKPGASGQVDPVRHVLAAEALPRH